jgi:hypothetical protein
VDNQELLLDVPGSAVSQGRVAVWGSSPAEQELLEKIALAHDLNDDSAPYSQVVVNNLGGNNPDDYLREKSTMWPMVRRRHADVDSQYSGNQHSAR